jgi:hypothetical protein
MRPTSPLSLLFLQLASALPLPTKELFLFDYHHSTCHSPIKPSTPPTTLKLSKPNFPTHQLSPAAEILDEINAPWIFKY